MNIDIPNANIIVNMHGCYTGITTYSPEVEQLFTEYRYASTGADTYAYHPGEEVMQLICSSDDLTESCRNLRTLDKESKKLSQPFIDKNKTQINEMCDIIQNIIDEANSENGDYEFKKQFFLHAIDIYFKFLKTQNYYTFHMEPVFDKFQTFLESNANVFILPLEQPSSMMRKTKKQTQKNKQLKTHCTKIKNFFDKFDREINESLDVRYRKPIGMPMQVFEGKRAEDKHCDNGFAISIIDGSLLDRVSKIYCELSKKDYALFKQTIQKYPDGVYLIKNNELYEFIKWCFVNYVEPDLSDAFLQKSIITLEKLSADFNLDNSCENKFLTNDVIWFVKFLRYAICKIIGISEDKKSDVKFGYLSLACNVYFGKKSTMEMYDIASSENNSPEPSHPGGGGFAGGKRKTRKQYRK